MKRALLVVTCGILLAASLRSLSNGPGTALPPPSAGGIAEIDTALKKISTNKRLLIIAAHPDDENTALLALVARGMGGEAAYLSLCRGEGGQNLIGDELGAALGLIRTGELVAARRLEGTHQFFTRAYDFGFSKSLEETLRFWPKEEILEDAVRIIRRFRPQVVVSVFSGTPRDGHGQHQESGLIAREAFRLAGDSARFPQLAKEGLLAWRPTALYQTTGFIDREKTTLVTPTGSVDALTGRSYNQIAMASRSLQRSQAMGRLQPAGPSETQMAWLEGGTGADAKDVFAGVETRLVGIAGSLPDAARRAQLQEHLASVERVALAARMRLTPGQPAAVVPDLVDALEHLRAARALLAADVPAEAPAAAILEEKMAAAENGLANAAGIIVDALSDAETAAPGESFEITAQVWNSGKDPIEVESVAPESQDGWNTSVASGPESKTLAPGTLAQWKLSASVPPRAAPTIPYFLKKPLTGAVYDWGESSPAVRGEPFQPPPLSVLAVIRVAGTRVTLRREATYRFRDEAFGEIRHALRAVPPVEISLEPELIVWPIGSSDKRSLQITVASNARNPVTGTVEIKMPPGWLSPAMPKFRLERKGEKASLEIGLYPASPVRPGRFQILISAVLSDGERAATSIGLIDYEHIRPTPMPRASALALTVVDLRLPNFKAVAYVRGAADRVPEALAAVGVPVHVLTASELEHGDLTRYDAIVIGSRAYELEPALASANSRILNYAQAGGLVLVQYQQYPFVEGHFTPDQFEIARPHDRVTDEMAKVTILDPSHPIFTTPNRIGPADWEGWVQERGLYFAHTWAPVYIPLLSMADPGEAEQKGSLLVARIGKGHYIYTGLAFFRELPAGVPGAYRLFTNLLAWRAK